ncbi:unnamed protein product [Rotaria socialis]|uniref:Uncharacterized protein n=1 Tax=Rotaria socialis TaxID=392032 RepID=A0A818GPI6_9BILA|nr:unnamed protein product [Rotaria socialis]CAF3493076.1 unnamed protein product [Rotaria socialis]
MNQSASSDRKSLLLFNLIQQYEMCRQQSQCYGLIPPPQPPMLPELILDNSSFTLANHRQYTKSFFITLTMCIVLISICLLSVIFQFYYKLRQHHHQTKHTNLADDVATFSRIAPSSYDSLTPLTTATDQSPLSTIASMFNLNHQQVLPSDDQSFYHNHSPNIYEKIRLPSDHYYCSCYLCVQAYHHHQQQQQQQYITSIHQLTPYYYTCESSSPSSHIVCQNCLLDNLHRKNNCFCHNFFIPIK